MKLSVSALVIFIVVLLVSGCAPPQSTLLPPTPTAQPTATAIPPTPTRSEPTLTAEAEEALKAQLFPQDAESVKARKEQMAEVDATCRDAIEFDDWEFTNEDLKGPIWIQLYDFDDDPDAPVDPQFYYELYSLLQPNAPVPGTVSEVSTLVCVKREVKALNVCQYTPQYSSSGSVYTHKPIGEKFSVALVDTRISKAIGWWSFVQKTLCPRSVKFDSMGRLDPTYEEYFLGDPVSLEELQEYIEGVWSP